MKVHYIQGLGEQFATLQICHMAKLKHGELLSHASYIVYNGLKVIHNALSYFIMLLISMHVHDITYLCFQGNAHPMLLIQGTENKLAHKICHLWHSILKTQYKMAFWLAKIFGSSPNGRSENENRIQNTIKLSCQVVIHNLVDWWQIKIKQYIHDTHIHV